MHSELYINNIAVKIINDIGLKLITQHIQLSFVRITDVRRWVEMDQLIIKYILFICKQKINITVCNKQYTVHMTFC